MGPVVTRISGGNRAAVGDVREVTCLACQAPVAAFESLGGDLARYAGDPVDDHIVPYETGHAPFLLP